MHQCFDDALGVQQKSSITWVMGSAQGGVWSSVQEAVQLAVKHSLTDRRTEDDCNNCIISYFSDQVVMSSRRDANDAFTSWDVYQQHLSRPGDGAQFPPVSRHHPPVLLHPVWCRWSGRTVYLQLSLLSLMRGDKGKRSRVHIPLPESTESTPGYTGRRAQNHALAHSNTVFAFLLVYRKDISWKRQWIITLLFVLISSFSINNHTH